MNSSSPASPIVLFDTTTSDGILYLIEEILHSEIYRHKD